MGSAASFSAEPGCNVDLSYDYRHFFRVLRTQAPSLVIPPCYAHFTQRRSALFDPSLSPLSKVDTSTLNTLFTQLSPFDLFNAILDNDGPLQCYAMDALFLKFLLSKKAAERSEVREMLISALKEVFQESWDAAADCGDASSDSKAVSSAGDPSGEIVPVSIVGEVEAADDEAAAEEETEEKSEITVWKRVPLTDGLPSQFAGSLDGQSGDPISVSMVFDHACQIDRCEVPIHFIWQIPLHHWIGLCRKDLLSQLSSMWLTLIMDGSMQKNPLKCRMSASVISVLAFHISWRDPGSSLECLPTLFEMTHDFSLIPFGCLCSEKWALDATESELVAMMHHSGKVESESVERWKWISLMSAVCVSPQRCLFAAMLEVHRMVYSHICGSFGETMPDEKVRRVEHSGHHDHHHHHSHSEDDDHSHHHRPLPMVPAPSIVVDTPPLFCYDSECHSHWMRAFCAFAVRFPSEFGLQVCGEMEVLLFNAAPTKDGRGTRDSSRSHFRELLGYLLQSGAVAVDRSLRPLSYRAWTLYSVASWAHVGCLIANWRDSLAFQALLLGTHPRIGEGSLVLRYLAGKGNRPVLAHIHSFLRDPLCFRSLAFLSDPTNVVWWLPLSQPRDGSLPVWADVQRDLRVVCEVFRALIAYESPGRAEIFQRFLHTHGESTQVRTAVEPIIAATLLTH